MDHERLRDFDLAVELFAQVDLLTQDIRPDIFDNGNQDWIFIPSPEQLVQARELFERYDLEPPDEIGIVKSVKLAWIDIHDQVHEGYESVWIGLTRNSIETEYAVKPNNKGKMVLTKDGRLPGKRVTPPTLLPGVEIDTTTRDAANFEAETIESQVLTKMLRIFGASE